MSLTGSTSGDQKKYELVPDWQIVVAGTTSSRSIAQSTSENSNFS